MNEFPIQSDEIPRVRPIKRLILNLLRVMDVFLIQRLMSVGLSCNKTESHAIPSTEENKFVDRIQVRMSIE